MNERQRIEKTIFYLRLAEPLCLAANDPASFDEIRNLIVDLERKKQNLNEKEKPEGNEP